MDAPSSRRRLLVVDDSVADARLVQALLRESHSGDVEIEHAGSAEEALARLAACNNTTDAEAFDCIFLDYQLGDASGLDVLRSIRDRGDDVPVVALSGSGSEEVAVAALKLEAQDYLVKGSLTSDSVGRSVDAAIEKVAQARNASDKEDELNAFSSAVAHDLKAPLRHIKALGQFLIEELEAGEADEVRAHATHIRTCAARMNALVTTLHGYAQLGRASTALVPVDLGEALGLAEHNLRTVLDEGSATIDAQRLPTVLGDVTALVQLFQNLVENAVKFRGEQPLRIAVTSSAGTRPGHCTVTVRDNGVGFEPGLAHKATQPCVRLHGNEYEGSGLGLWICQQIAEQHGGSLHLESSPGSGTAVTFSAALAGRAPADDACDEAPTPRRTKT